MRGRLQAALVVAATAVLSLLIPPALILSGAPLALITLRQGQREGALLMIMATLGSVVLALPLFTHGLWVVGILLLFWLPMWGLALVLRATVSLALTLSMAAAFGAAGVLAFYLLLGDPGAWWLQVLNQLKPVFQAAGLVVDEAVLDESLRLLAPFMPGLALANLLAYLLFGLLLGRWWQATLFNPGGFRKEFHALALGRGMALVAISVFALTLVLDWHLMTNLALILGMIYALQGIALIHGVVGRAGLSRGWLMGFYLLMLFALPQLVLLLCMIGVIDAWVDIRARIKPRAGPV